MSTPADKLTALGFSAQQAELLVATFAASGAPVAAAPSFSPAGGVYSTPQTVSINSSTPNSAIYFTEDGSTPTFPPTGTTQTYVNAIAVSASTTIQAIVAASGYQDSPVQSISYVINIAGNQATTPIATPPAGTYATSQQVSLTCVTAGATIYFTLDGSTPTILSTIYAAPFTVAASEVIKALAVAPGYTPSAVLIAPFVIAGPTTLPVTFSPAGGTYTSTQTVTLACASPGPSIYYTLDGTTPTYPITGTTQLYTGTISVAASETITAIATSSGLANSAPSNAAYVITTQAAAPTFSPVAGSYAGNQNVTLGLPTNGTGYYTTDGSTPAVVGGVPQGTTQLYTSAGIPIPPGSATVAAPTFSPAAGTYAGGQNVSIIPPAGATAYYTLDGSTPTTGSAVYSAAIAVSTSETIKAIAVAGGIVSSVASAAYVIGSGGGGTGLTSVFNYPNFNSTAGLNTTPGSAQVTAGVINLIVTGAGHVASCTWYNTLVNLASGCTVDWSFRFNQMTSVPSICGGALVFQNTTSPPGASGYTGAHFVGDANCCGYGCYNPTTHTSGQYPPVNSAAIKFDANAASNVGGYVTAPSSTGYYEEGGSYNGEMPYIDLQPDGVNFYNSNIIKGHVVYDGVGTLVCTLTDTVTGAQSRMEYPANLQNAVGSNTAYVGFTAGSAGSTPEGLDLLSFSFGTGYLTRLSQPTFSPAGGQYSGSQIVTLSAAAGATIYYTLNGLMPTTASTQYTGPITVAANMIVKAIAVQSGYTDSITASAVYRIGTSLYVNCGTGFSASNTGIEVCGSAARSSGVINLTTASTQASEGASGSMWYMQPVPVTTFSATFTLQYGTSNSSGMGTCFVLQNANAAKSSPGTARTWSGGLHAVGGNRYGFGQGGNISDSGGDVGFQNSLAVAFDPSNNSVSLVQGGAQCNVGQQPTGINFSLGNPINCTLAYDGTNLVLTMVDSVVGGTPYSKTWSGFNIPSIVGGNTAYAGFTASGYYNIVNTQRVTKWTM